MEKVLIGYNGASARASAAARDINALLRAEGFECVTCGGDEPQALEGCTCAVTVGGDGTIIRWGKAAAQRGVPVLGVNMGRLGFMATLERSELSRIPGLLTERGRLSRRMLMDCEVLRGGEVVMSRLVLNDAVFSRGSASKLPEFSVFCRSGENPEKEVSRLRADGVILSTPTGSTAYSLSAGGPIIAPDLECIEFTALCPHSLFNRPMILSAQQTVNVRCRFYQGSSVTVSFDGENAAPFLEGDELRLRKSAFTLDLIEAGEGFFGAVHNKLMTPLK